MKSKVESHTYYIPPPPPLKTEPTNPMQLLQEQVVADTAATAALKETYLQQERKLEDLQGTVAARSFQIQEFEDQVREKNIKLQDTVTAQGLQLHEMVEKVREKKAQQQEVTSDPSSATVAEGGLRLRWTVEESAPKKMTRGQAVVDGCMVYLSADQTDGRVIYSYDSERKVWSTLPECPHWEHSLAVVNGLLTAIGGIERIVSSDYTSRYTNTLLSLIVKDKETDEEWRKYFHPMPTKRAKTAAVCTEKALVVTGGEDRSGVITTTVEVMDTETSQWSTARSLPPPGDDYPFYRVSATVCGDYLLYFWGYSPWEAHLHFPGLRRESSHAVLICSLSDLLKSCQPQPLVSQKTTALTSREAVWQEVADVPVEDITCVAFNGHLRAIGESNSNGRPTNIYTLNPITKSWKVTSQIPTPRSHCLAAALPGNKLMVVGGCRWHRSHGTNLLDIVEIAEVI